MTVETTKNKTDKQVMGSYTYDFDFDCLLQDPTEEDAKQAVKVTITDGVQEYPLEYGTDYSHCLSRVWLDARQRISRLQCFSGENARGKHGQERHACAAASGASRSLR